MKSHLSPESTPLPNTAIKRFGLKLKRKLSNVDGGPELYEILMPVSLNFYPNIDAITHFLYIVCTIVSRSTFRSTDGWSSECCGEAFSRHARRG